MGRASASERRADSAAALATLGRLMDRFGGSAGADGPGRHLPHGMRRELAAGLAYARDRVADGKSPVTSIRASLSLVRAKQRELADAVFGRTLRELADTLADMQARKAGDAKHGESKGGDAIWE